MPIIDPSLGIKLIVLMGISNLIWLILVRLSCRCMLKHKFYTNWMKNKRFDAFFNLHCFFWLLLEISVLIHVTLVLLIFGIPLFS